MRHIRLTSHPGQGATGAPSISWGAPDALERGPIVGTTTNRSQRNVVGTHSGSYGVYRALAVAAGNLLKGHRADLTNTAPTDLIGPYPQWGDASKMVSIDPWGASVQNVYADYIAQGYDIRPTIAVTKAHIHLPEIKPAIAFQRLAIDGMVLLDDASAEPGQLTRQTGRGMTLGYASAEQITGAPNGPGADDGGGTMGGVHGGKASGC